MTLRAIHPAGSVGATSNLRGTRLQNQKSTIARRQNQK
jgi:hypothetical protein